jgi:hypothetical protein
MKLLWFILSLIPIPFLYHFYEYVQHIKGLESSPLILVPIFILTVVIGVLSNQVEIRYVLWINILTVMMSMLLATNLIIDDGNWLKPEGIDRAVVFASLLCLLGQLSVRFICRCIYKGKFYRFHIGRL